MIRLSVSLTGHAIFWCPACQDHHQFYVRPAPKEPVWWWNGSMDSPTVIPSILVTYPANPNAIEEFKEWRTERRCHLYITDGHIRFEPDSTHAMAGQTVMLPEWQGL